MTYAPGPAGEIETKIVGSRSSGARGREELGDVNDYAGLYLAVVAPLSPQKGKKSFMWFTKYMQHNGEIAEAVVELLEPELADSIYVISPAHSSASVARTRGGDGQSERGEKTRISNA